jgi:hypothetical protein
MAWPIALCGLSEQQLLLPVSDITAVPIPGAEIPSSFVIKIRGFTFHDFFILHLLFGY